MPKSPFNLDISWNDPAWRRNKKVILPLIESALNEAARNIKGFPKRTCEISLVLTNDNDIKILNREHRGKNKPTNVLSFPQYPDLKSARESDDPLLILGDIVVSYQTLRRECKDENKTFPDHFTHLLVHGFLHLLGYDHMNDKDAKTMESLEVKILKKLGVRNPYSPL